MIMMKFENLSDESLFELIKKNDKGAFEELYDRFSSLLYLHAYRMLRDQEEARDVVQEMFINLWEKKENIVIKTVSAYLYSSIRNRVLDKISKEKSKSKYLESMSFYQVNYNHEIPDRQLYEKELKTLIEKEIDCMPKRMREIFLLSRFEYLTHRKIGEKLGISEATVKKQVNNALKILKYKLQNRIIKIILLFLYTLPIY